MEWGLYLVTGACAGFLSGLLGVGGGLIIVPALLLLLAPLVPPQQIMHVALGSALASIIFSAISSARAHHLRQGIHWSVAWRLIPGVMLGTLVGAWLAAQMQTEWLKRGFVIFLFYAGIQLMREPRPPASRPPPGKGALSGAGVLIGFISSLVGIGGGSLTVPLLLRYQYPLRKAIGTSALVGLPLAIAGAGGYAVMGWQVAGLPPYSVGFVYLPAVAGISLASVLTAPTGARLAHRLPATTLKRVFALLLFARGIKMLWGVF